MRTVPLCLAALFAGLLFGEHLPVEGIFFALCAGMLASSLGYALWYRLLPAYSLQHAAIIQLAVPVITAFLAYLLLGESVTLLLVFSSILILGGIALAIVCGRHGRENNES